MVDLNRGTLVSRALRQSWRTHHPNACLLTREQLDSVAPLLYESGAAGLGWWRIRDTEFRDTPSGELLHQAFRLLALRARAHETEIENLFRLFREANVEVSLVKGWAIARCYSEPALRPYGDIDLLVRPSDFDAAARVLQSEDARNYFTDLHLQMFELADRSIEEVFSRSQLVQCGAERVRVLAVEDHLALLAIHLLKHAAWRPLWLCDIGMLLDTMSDDFDWDICLGRDKRRANWILSVAGIAHALLGAEINDGSVAHQARQVPDWLVARVLKNWETPFAHLQAPLKHSAPIRSYFRHPPGLLKDLARRWPDPILATVTVNGIFGKRQRMRYQFGNWLLRAARLATTGGVN
ncbi:MAG: hypothetical protein DMF72_13095 [Acidobacteria bacterium]|nr:MAG: hypothetical protein DMF72_13095 [Acidobacteriota bacterium]